ncbi:MULTISPECIES: hypothetical protein [Sphingobacterium]|uniref:Uncharacterized protein n=1 Tax=Sphingobacterium athyrii TaxID=2152717 RepID=A0A363NW12_9SPHI|nr:MULTISPECIES: hypothetical protein [Sphingobacterium]PUV24995.1 hypothetical protein DCO56_08600 [Sphingobacterium athyrii]QIH34903.1 hypothetical protein G6053_19260 [Sphingobacterium sp. DR205]
MAGVNIYTSQTFHYLLNGLLNCDPWALRYFLHHSFCTIFPVLPPKVENSLFELDKTLIPVISILEARGDEKQERLRELIKVSSILAHEGW